MFKLLKLCHCFLSTVNNEDLTADEYSVRDQISVGEWCIFSRNEYDSIFSQRARQRDDDGHNLKFLLGMVLGLTYLDGKTFKQREFSKTSAIICHSKVNAQRGVGVLCSFYTCAMNGLLTNVPGDTHRFINIESYAATIKSPIYEKKLLSLSTKLVDKLSELI